MCGPGTAKTSAVQGVTDKKIQVGVMSDVGFTKNSEFPDAAKVFTSWCNAAGGINGREIVPVTRDTKLMQVRQGVLQACKADFALVGGGSALDSLGTPDRLKCLLPTFPAQSSQIGAIGSDLQVMASQPTAGYFQYAGYYAWLMKEKYPDSAQKAGIIAGDVPVTKVMAGQFKEAIAGLGGKVSYNDLYPAAGVSDWTPYAQSIKNKGVKGLVFLGDFASLAKLEQALTNIGYTPTGSTPTATPTAPPSSNSRAPPSPSSTTTPNSSPPPRWRARPTTWPPNRSSTCSRSTRPASRSPTPCCAPSPPGCCSPPRPATAPNSRASAWTTTR